jgi:hypothetical protein
MFEAYPVELRPVLTRHRLRRRRHRSAASVLTGAALALGFTASRPAPAGAATVRHATPHAARAAPALRILLPSTAS